MSECEFVNMCECACARVFVCVSVCLCVCVCYRTHSGGYAAAEGSGAVGQDCSAPTRCPLSSLMPSAVCCENHTLGSLTQGESTQSAHTVPGWKTVLLRHTVLDQLSFSPIPTHTRKVSVGGNKQSWSQICAHPLELLVSRSS